MDQARSSQIKPVYAGPYQIKLDHARSSWSMPDQAKSSNIKIPSIN
jgi:hypothetical protein